MRIETAKAIIKRHQETAPVHVIPLAEELGINVFYVDWPNDTSGMIRKGDGDSYSIFVNQNHHSHRRRFTMAHECAHFILHREAIGDGIYDDALYRSGLPNKLEYEANRMAADILMPHHLISQALDDGYSTIEELADLFEVSRSAMSIRMGVPYED
jgi:Zn-dependent peptidase ImmA (M78 family)